MNEKNRITSNILGIGGIFFKANNPKNLQDWYSKNFGFYSQIPYSEDDDAISFAWKTMTNENENTVWAPFNNDTEYFNPSTKDFMINYIVRDMNALLLELKEKGIEQIDEIQTAPYGKFVHIMDPEGNKIEFWEPNRTFFEKKYNKD